MLEHDGHNPFSFDPSFLNLTDLLGQETGRPPEAFESDIAQQRARILEQLVNSDGKYRILGIDTYDHEDWIAGEFDTPEAAMDYVRQRNEQAQAAPNYIRMRWSLDGRQIEHTVGSTTVFYAYSPEGEWLGI